MQLPKNTKTAYFNYIKGTQTLKTVILKHANTYQLS